MIYTADVPPRCRWISWAWGAPRSLL